MSDKVTKTVTFDYEFTNSDGEPDIRELTMKSARLLPNRIARLPYEVVTAEAMRWAMSEDDFAWWDEIPSSANEYGTSLVNAWQKASEITLGESEAS